MTMTEKEFDLYQEEKLRQYEALCKRCGACCGAWDDNSCSHLVLSEDNKYFCDIYEDRFGLRRTAKGGFFLCLPVRKILFKSWTGAWQCSYKQNIKL